MAAVISHADRVAIYVVPKDCSVPLTVELNVPRSTS